MSLIERMLKRKLKEVTSNKFVIELNLPKEYPPIPARKTEDGGVRDRFMAAKAELPDEITVVRPFNVNGFEGSNANTVYVSVDGCDCNCGSRDKPLATLSEALKRVAGGGGARIILRGGSYTVTETVRITAEHSGTQESPLIITNENGEIPYLSGGVLIPCSAFEKVTDDEVYFGLHPKARDNILVCDLKALGICDYGTIGRHGTMLVVNGDKYDYARYPNECDEVARLPMKDAIVFAGDREKPWELGISDEKCLGWKWTDDIWVYGSFFYEWTHLYMKLSEINKQTKTMKGDVNDPEYRSIAYQHEFSHYFVNVLEELDVPGEWHLDRENGKLYVYPKNGCFNTSDDIRFVVPNVECRSDVIVVDGAKNVIINGLDVGRTNGAPVIVKNSKQVLLQRCRFTSYSKEIDIGVGCKKCGMIASRCEYFAETAAVVGGGNRPQLEPGNNFLQNNILFNSKVASGMASRNGVGNVVSHNYLYNTRFSDGQNNECIMEYNIVEGGDTETSDSGMIYVGYGGCSTGGNHYRYNYFFDFAKLDYGIYFDDMARGMYAYGNVVVGNGVNPCHEDKNGKWWPSGGRTYNVHNGGENVFYNNISIDAGYFAFGGDITYWLFDANWNSLFGTIYESSLDKRNEKFMGRNPTYREYVQALDQYKEDKKDPNYVIKSGWAEKRLRTPWYNHIENNLIFRADRPYKLDIGEEFTTGLDTNYVTNDDPGFADLANRNYRILPDAEVFKHIPDFVPPPFEKMGPVDDYE